MQGNGLDRLRCSVGQHATHHALRLFDETADRLVSKILGNRLVIGNGPRTPERVTQNCRLC